MQVELDPSQTTSSFGAWSFTFSALVLLGLAAVFVYQQYQLKLGATWQLFWIALMLLTPLFAGLLLMRVESHGTRLLVLLAMLLSLYGTYQGVFYLRQRLLMNALKQNALGQLNLGQAWSTSYYADAQFTSAYWMFDRREIPAGALSRWKATEMILPERAIGAPKGMEYFRELHSGEAQFLAILTIDEFISLEIKSESMHQKDADVLEKRE
jgi:hypothetical protein